MCSGILHAERGYEKSGDGFGGLGNRNPKYTVWGGELVVVRDTLLAYPIGAQMLLLSSPAGLCQSTIFITSVYFAPLFQQQKFRKTTPRRLYGKTLLSGVAFCLLTEQWLTSVLTLKA